MSKGLFLTLKKVGVGRHPKHFKSLAILSVMKLGMPNFIRINSIIYGGKKMGEFINSSNNLTENEAKSWKN